MAALATRRFHHNWSFVFHCFSFAKGSALQLWKGVNTAIMLDRPTVQCLVEMASLAVLLQSHCVGGLHTNQKKIRPCLCWCVLLWVVWRNLSWITNAPHTQSLLCLWCHQLIKQLPFARAGCPAKGHMLWKWLEGKEGSNSQNQHFEPMIATSLNKKEGCNANHRTPVLPFSKLTTKVFISKFNDTSQFHVDCFVHGLRFVDLRWQNCTAEGTWISSYPPQSRLL